MREAIVGKKKAKQEAHAVLDEETKELVVANSEIKRVTLEYCLKVLSIINQMKISKSLQN